MSIITGGVGVAFIVWKLCVFHCMQNCMLVICVGITGWKVELSWGGVFGAKFV
jgi:hypothetical protein